jgi:hypothetical protein
MSSVVKRKRGKEEPVTPKEKMLYRFIKTLSKEIGISIPAIISVVEAYNIFLWRWFVQPALLKPVVETGKAIKTITMASKDALINIVRDMKDYIFYEPIEITACAANLYLDENSGPFTEQLQKLAYDLGEESLKHLGMEAQKITAEIMGEFVSPLVDKYLLPITGSNYPQLPKPDIPLLGLSVAPKIPLLEDVKVPEINVNSLALTLPGDIPIDKAQGKVIQIIETKTERKVVASSVEILLAHTACRTMDSVGKKINWKIPERCISVLREQNGINSLQKNCPRVYQDMQKTIHRQIEDFADISNKAIRRGIQDTQIGIERSAYDVMSSFQVFICFFFLYIIFHATFRAVFSRLAKKFYRK